MQHIKLTVQYIKTAVKILSISTEDTSSIRSRTRHEKVVLIIINCYPTISCAMTGVNFPYCLAQFPSNKEKTKS